MHVFSKTSRFGNLLLYMTVHTKKIEKGGLQKQRSTKTEVFKNASESGDFKTKVYSSSADGENQGFRKTHDVMIICMLDFGGQACVLGQRNRLRIAW